MKEAIKDFIGFLFDNNFIEPIYPRDFSDITILDEETFAYTLEEIYVEFLESFVQYIATKKLNYYIKAEEDSCLLVISIYQESGF